MNALRYVNVLESFDPVESVLFVGSGISYPEPTKLPMGDGLRNLYLAPLPEIYSALEPFVTLLTAQEAKPRLEIALQKLVKVAGIELLSTLALLNEAKPNRNHVILAQLLQDKKLALVLTTNFDNLIEQADESLRTYYADEPLNMGQIRGGIFKLHGDARYTNSVVATVERIGEESLNKSKINILKQVFEAKYVYVYGYSGMDEDIVEPIRNFRWRGLFWFDKEKKVRPEVKQMLEPRRNGHFIPLGEFTLLEDIGRRLGLQVPRDNLDSLPTWSQSQMKRAVRDCLASLGQKAARYVVGSLLRQISLNEDARSVLAKAVEANPEDRSELIGWIHLELGKIEQGTRHSEQAIEHCQKARSCQLGEHDIADAACTEAYVHIMHGGQSKAVTVLQKASEHIPDDHPAQARILFTQGDAYFELDQLGEALNRYEQARRIYEEKEGMLGALPRCYNQLGKVCLDQGNLKQAKEYYEMVLRYSQRLDDRYHESCALINLGELDWYFGDIESARKKVREGIELENQFMSNWIENATTCDIYAKILIDLEEVEAAEEQVDRGLDLIGNARPSQQICLYALKVRICGLQGRLDEGSNYIEKGLQLLDSAAESMYDVQWFFLYSADFYLRRNHLDEAQGMLNRVADMLGERGSYCKAFYFYLSSLLCKRSGDLISMRKLCQSCRDVIRACGIKPVWLSLLPA